MKEIDLLTRRSLLKGIGLLTSLSLAPGRLNAAEGGGTPDVSPLEDLMREHGVLSRVLLIYEEILGRARAGRSFPVEVIHRSADMIRRFIEDYHEKLEEEYLFPRFEKAGRLVELVRILKEQHQSGRRLTDSILGWAQAMESKEKPEESRLIKDLSLFIRMYRPHKAREDTVLFPALHSLISAKDLDRLGDQFEDREKALFGENGFGQIVNRVAGMERELGIFELSRVTPKN
jgi:hemerythrin-like domain-containing protein